jgi:CheY-like chemotaxis protein
VTSPDAAAHALESRAFDLVLMDLNYTGDTTSGREGIDLLARVQVVDALLPVIVMTGWGSVDLAVEAMRRGVRDFVQKPWDNAQLLTTLHKEIEAGRARRREDAAERRELSEALKIQQRPAAAGGAADRRLGAVGLMAARVGRGRRLLRHDPLRRHPPRHHDRRRRRQGIPAALLMSNLQAAVRAFASEAAEPQALCHQVNRILCGNIAEGRFISFILLRARRDRRRDHLHQRGTTTLPMLVHADGSVERLASAGPCSAC